MSESDITVTAKLDYPNILGDIDGDGTVTGVVASLIRRGYNASFLIQ